MASELFELELLGGPVERRYRKLRPEIDAMPWGTLDPNDYPPDLVMAARKSWTGGAFQEHRTGVAMAQTVKALMECRAPLDLIAMATRFPLDELVHIELCSRMAMELGGATPILHDPDHLVVKPLEGVDPVLRCADLVVRFFCVGEALSIPMLRATWRASEHPLPKAVLGRIVKDEAAHGAFGWFFLDWASPLLSDADREVLAKAADDTVVRLKAGWEHIRQRPKGPPSAVHSLGWMQTDAYLALAQKSLERNVLAPLRKRGIPVRSTGKLEPLDDGAGAAEPVGFDPSGRV